MEFLCQVCLGRFDPEGHRPLLLPACGHTFCATCVQLLGQQGKTACPKCRKDKAVQPVSSLPVNYSLLEIVQSKFSGAGDEERPPSPTEPSTGEGRRYSPSSPDTLPEHLFSPRGVNSGNLFLRRSRLKRIKQGASQPSSVRGNLEYAPASPSASGCTALPTPARRTTQEHSPCPSQTGPDRELQDDLDFRMAVHLTFCKDGSHDLDQHTSCPVWRQENEDHEDLATTLALMQQM